MTEKNRFRSPTLELVSVLGVWGAVVAMHALGLNKQEGPVSHVKRVTSSAAGNKTRRSALGLRLESEALTVAHGLRYVCRQADTARPHHVLPALHGEGPGARSPCCLSSPSPPDPHSEIP